MDNGHSNEKILKNLGSKLRKARDRVKMTQAEVADSAGIHVNYYARMERGEENPTYEVLVRVKRALKIESDLL